MNEQERYYPVVIKSLRAITQRGHQLAHDAIDAVETYCFALPGSTRKRKADALEAINVLKSNSTSLRLSYHSALLWLVGELDVAYDVIRYNLKDHYKLPWDYELEAKCDRRAPARPWARRRPMGRPLINNNATLTLAVEIKIQEK